MSREIKFRAWDKECKRMLIVDEIKWPTRFNNGWIENVATDGRSGSSGVWEDFELMQFTGLKDKNGKEIWEGDIIAISGAKWEIEWNFGMAAYFCKAIGVFSVYCLTNGTAKTMEVVGNVHENPELLK